MLRGIGNLRRGASQILRSLTSLEATSSGRASPFDNSFFSGWRDHTAPAAEGCSPRWRLGAPAGARGLSSLEAEAAEPRQATYYVEIITGDVRGAGSPAPAAITLFGEDGESESHVIGAENSGSGFERATRKTYAVYCKDLGQLKRVLVQQLAPTSETDHPTSIDDASQPQNTGWYLDRVEVRGPEGDYWVFPCGTWLGRPGSADDDGSDACNERNLIPTHPYRDIHRSSLHDPTHRITRPLSVEASGVALPHPEKVQQGAKGVNRKGFGHGGEDSYFFASNRNGIFALGVADGVYAWRSMGIDAGAFSRQLMEYCRQAVELGTTDVLRVLQFATRHLRRSGVQGSSTACLVLVDTLQGRLAAANVGDSGFMLLGRRPGTLRSTAGGSLNSQLQVRYRSPQQEHSFGHPYQLGHHEAADSPEDAMLATMAVYPGDVLVMGSDGLFDNLSDEEVVQRVESALLQGQSPSAVAQVLAFEAFNASMDKKRATPYSLAASEAFDLVFNGGKADDITALVLKLD